jgi:hypothetical protein
MRRTKREIRAELMRMIGEGQRLITGAEFRFAFNEITREELESDCAKGNGLLMDALDQAEAAGVRLPY